MIDINLIRYDGSINHQSGLDFYYVRGSHCFCILIREAQPGVFPYKITIQPDRVEHNEPHVHVTPFNAPQRDIGHHGVSFSINNPRLLAGARKLSSREETFVISWINSHQSDLITLWNILLNGKDYTEPLKRVQTRWEEGGVFFDGEKPSKSKVIEGKIKVWFNGSLSDPTLSDDGKVCYKCSQDICILRPNVGDYSNIVFSGKKVQDKTREF